VADEVTSPAEHEHTPAARVPIYRDSCAIYVYYVQAKNIVHKHTAHTNKLAHKQGACTRPAASDGSLCCSTRDSRVGSGRVRSGWVESGRVGSGRRC